MFFGWVFFLISSGSPHARPMGHACGEPDEIGLTPVGVELNGSGRGPCSTIGSSLAVSMAPNAPDLAAWQEVLHAHDVNGMECVLQQMRRRSIRSRSYPSARTTWGVHGAYVQMG